MGNGIEIYNFISDCLIESGIKIEKQDMRSYSPLTLAYIGDGVYELYVRGRLIEEHPDMPPHKLHILATAHVKAKSQSRSMVIIETMLRQKCQIGNSAEKCRCNRISPCNRL